MARDEVIRAAGVVLLRDAADGRQFLAVHRPLRADWSLPKGKTEPGEHLVGAAVRECDEETGFTPILQAPLPTQSYSVLSRPKVVNYWRARERSDEGFAADDEVDEIRWVPVGDAGSVLTYPSDVNLVRRASALPDTIPLVILRHTQAMKRADFTGDVDVDRPLTGKGRSQSKALIPLLEAFGVTRVHASSASRCTETVQRFAAHLGTSVESEPDLTEEEHHGNPSAASARAAALALEPSALVLCSHRPVLPTILDAMSSAMRLDLTGARAQQAWDPRLPPGGFIVVHRAFGDDGSVQVMGLERHTLSGG
jgi:8-oxo-dGTP diphosphatase